MNQTTSWTCDACGLPINDARDGWVEWVTYKNADGQDRGRGLRLVHHQPASPRKSGCQYDGKQEFQRDRGILSDQSLDSFLGPDGLMLLLSLISEGELPQAEVIEMIQRIHIPGYEHARHHFPDALARGVIEPNLPPGFHWQADIERVIKAYGKA
jgi:hypothetical protein